MFWIDAAGSGRVPPVTQDQSQTLVIAAHAVCEYEDDKNESDSTDTEDG